MGRRVASVVGMGARSVIRFQFAGTGRHTRRVRHTVGGMNANGAEPQESPSEDPLLDLHRAWSQRAEQARTQTVPGVERPGAAEGHRTGGGAEPHWIRWGEGEKAPPVVAMFDAVELEYAAFRRGVAVVDQTQRGCIQICGADAEDLLERLLTQKIGGMKEGEVRDSFRTSRKGRVEDDLRVIRRASDFIVVSDVGFSKATAEAIEAFMFGEDVEIKRPSWRSIGLYGPKATEALAAGLNAVGDGAEAVLLVDEPACQGAEVLVRIDVVRAFWGAVTEIKNARPAGWFAQNLIRLEAGQPRFGIDFNHEFLPHETDLVHRRVSFTKGCYPGQEVVARMQHLADGATKRRVVGFHFPAGEVPPAGAPILRDEEGAPGEVLGQVTSSGPSPMASSRGIGLGVLVKAAKDADLLVVNEDGPGRVTVVARSELVPPVLREEQSDEGNSVEGNDS